MEMVNTMANTMGSVGNTMGNTGARMLEINPVTV